MGPKMAKVAFDYPLKILRVFFNFTLFWMSFLWWVGGWSVESRGTGK